jgi:putative addiction module component (TIGR02574 family)
MGAVPESESSMTTEQLEQRVAALEQTVADLQRQVAILSLNGDADELPIELTDELKAEIDRRLADAEANPHDAVPWEEVEASIRERLKRLKK